MHEHGSEKRQKITEGIGKEAAGNESPLPNKNVTATLLYKEKQDVQSDQGIRDQRNSSARGIIITDWEHKIYLLAKESDLLAINPSFAANHSEAAGVWIHQKRKKGKMFTRLRDHIRLPC
jgi:hypothetical protein